jgi:uncharacterized membrane protein
MIKPLIVFLIGAIIGAVTMKFGTFHCLAIPLFLLVAIFSDIILKIFMDKENAFDDGVVKDKAG